MKATKAVRKKDRDEAKAYREISLRFNDWLKASLKLALSTYSRGHLNRLLGRKDPYCDLHRDAIQVMKTLRGLGK